MAIQEGGGHNGGGRTCQYHRTKSYRKFCCFLLISIVLALLLIIVVYLVLRPHNPAFHLQDLTVLCLNITPPASAHLFTTMQATVAARNPNDRVGVYYDHAHVYARYRGVPITVNTLLPFVYQRRHEKSVWSPYLRTFDPVVLSPKLARALALDETDGQVLIDIGVQASVRWKIGPWVSGHHRLRVKCPALIIVNGGEGSYGATTGGGTDYFKLQKPCACKLEE